jgi:uncharacterized protein (TIGR03083 family)
MEWIQVTEREDDVTALGFDRFAAELRAEAGAFASTVDGADLALPVPTCPEWTLEQLVHHVGRAYYWAAAIVTSATTTFIPFESVPGAGLPEQPGKHGDWLRNGAEQLVSAVAETGAESTVWTWAQDSRAGFWLRRLTHETVVHRADAAFAAGRPYELAADLAADGVSESLELLASRMMVMPSPALASLAGTGQTLHFHATDDGLGDAGEWLIRCTPDGPLWEHGHGKADVAVRAAAADLLLVLTGRIDAGNVKIEVFGDDALFEHWRENAKF